MDIASVNCLVWYLYVERKFVSKVYHIRLLFTCFNADPQLTNYLKACFIYNDFAKATITTARKFEAGVRVD